MGGAACGLRGAPMVPAVHREGCLQGHNQVAFGRAEDKIECPPLDSWGTTLHTSRLPLHRSTPLASTRHCSSVPLASTGRVPTRHRSHSQNLHLFFGLQVEEACAHQCFIEGHTLLPFDGVGTQPVFPTLPPLVPACLAGVWGMLVGRALLLRHNPHAFRSFRLRKRAYSSAFAKGRRCTVDLLPPCVLPVPSQCPQSCHPLCWHTAWGSDGTLAGRAPVLRHMFHSLSLFSFRECVRTRALLSGKKSRCWPPEMLPVPSQCPHPCHPK